MSVSKGGKTMAFISPVKINELNNSCLNELIYGHYVYIFGNSSDDKNNTLEYLSKSGLIIYVQSNVHNEMTGLIESTKIPYILITNLEGKGEIKASSKIEMSLASKKSLHNLASNFARYCKFLFVNKNYTGSYS